MQNLGKPVFTATMHSEVPASLDDKRFIDKDGNILTRYDLNCIIEILKNMGNAIELAINEDCSQMLVYNTFRDLTK